MIDIVKVKGKERSVCIFEVLERQEASIAEAKFKSRGDFEKAIQMFHNRKYHEALQIFSEILDNNPADYSCKIYVDRCAEAMAKFVNIAS